MMMFTLSKLNLLILVMALAAIFLVFYEGITDRLCDNIGEFEADKIAAEAHDVLKGGQFPICSSSFYTIPRELICKSRRVFYTMDVSFAPGSVITSSTTCTEDSQCPATQTCNKGTCARTTPGRLTFSIFSIEHPDQVLAAKSLGIDPGLNVKIHDVFRASDGTIGEPPKIEVKPGPVIESGKLTLDPQSRALLDSVVFVKEVNKGKQFFHIIPCSATLGRDNLGSCERAMLCVGCSLEPNEPEDNRFTCFGVNPDDPNRCPAEICELGSL